MTAGPPPADDFDTPAEARVHTLLADLAEAAPAPAADLPARVVRRARWQRPLRQALELATGLAGAAVAGAGIVARRGGRS